MNAQARTAAVSAAPSAVRLDIQFLRGIAVLAVLFYHSDVLPLAGGYLGVDIFFVISGYLITRNILGDIDKGRFSFVDFYARRARRLLPAAYCTLIVTTLLASQVLTQDRWDDFVEQLLGALTFTANFVVPQQTGYFETTAETKPLLHMWSLSVEEQYYLVAPLLMVVLRPRWRIASLGALATASLALCVALVSSSLTYWRVPWLDSQQFAFFMLPARAWEMLAGSLLAAATLTGWRIAPPRWFMTAALGLLVLVCLSPLERPHPRADAVIAVALTALLVAGDGRWLGHGAPVRAIAKVGDWSYSLYLVHWPLFALATCAYLGRVPAPVRIGLIVLSVVLAWLQYRYVEQRFRHGQRADLRLALRFGAGALAVAALPMALAAVRAPHDPAAVANPLERNQGISARCAAGGGAADPSSCSTSPQPTVAVWGDSYVMHLMPGLRQLDTVGPSMMQLTKAACAPVRGIASIDQNYDVLWAQSCLEFNERAFEIITGTPSIRHVIMSSPFAGYLDHGALTLYHRGQQKTGDRTIAIDEFTNTLRGLLAQGKTPILVAPPPKPGFDIGACREQRGAGLIVLGRQTCDFAHAEHLRNQAGIVAGLQEVARRTGVALVWLDGPICAHGSCSTALPDGTSIYTDGGHLSAPASRWLVPQLGIDGMLQQPAGPMR